VTTVRVTKEQIIAALRVEPLLEAGSWADPRYTRGPVEKCAIPLDEVQHCYVCGVGAVLRRAVLDAHETVGALVRAAVAATDGWPVTPGGSESYLADAARAVESGFHMSAISLVFEGTYSEDWSSIEDCRSAAIVFVEQHFPETVLIDIDGARPARDVQVVER
jgi:hypothetical protein